MISFLIWYDRLRCHSSFLQNLFTVTYPHGLNPSYSFTFTISVVTVPFFTRTNTIW